jgi:hypothetical protein
MALSESISVLQEALANANTGMTLAPLSQEDSQEVFTALPGSEFLGEWYRTGSPAKFSVRWSAEWINLFAPAELVEQDGFPWRQMGSSDYCAKRRSTPALDLRLDKYFLSKV